jgi:hypothetical protein
MTDLTLTLDDPLRIELIMHGIVRVELEDIGEGWEGEYNPDNPDDEELVRFTVSKIVPAGPTVAGADTPPSTEWEQIDDASYCTQIPVRSDPSVLLNAIFEIAQEVYDDVAHGRSIKRTCERLSWLSPQALTSRSWVDTSIPSVPNLNPTKKG